MFTVQYKQITEILFAGDSDFQVPNCYFLVAGHSFVCTQGWRRYLRALEGDPVPFERETNETDKFSKGRQGVSIQWRHLKIDMRWSVFYSLHYRIITTKGDGQGGLKGARNLHFPHFQGQLSCWKEREQGLGKGVDHRGGVESRSDLPDLKSSKVDFKVDFLTKVW